MFFKSKKIIGLDIGTSAIKISELTLGRRGMTLENFGFMPSPSGAISGGEILDSSSLSRTIKSLVNESKTKRKKAAIGLWGTAVIVKKVTIPRIEESLVAEQIKWEAEQYIPFDINEISLCHHILKKTPQSGDTMDVLIVAAQNELVFHNVSTVQEAGLECSIVDVSGFALANLFELNYGAIPGYTVLLNIGAGVTNFVILHEGEVVFCRDIAVGGQMYTTEIHKELGVTIPEAESLKLSAVNGGEVPSEVHTILSTTNESVAEEVRNSFEFFLATSPAAKISNCFMSGGSMGVMGLKDALSNVTGVQVQELDPFRKLELNPKKFDRLVRDQIRPFVAVSLGLGLRQLGDSQ